MPDIGAQKGDSRVRVRSLKVRFLRLWRESVSESLEDGHWCTKCNSELDERHEMIATRVIAESAKDRGTRLPNFRTCKVNFMAH